MNRELVTLGCRHDDHLQEVARTIRPDDEPTVGIFASIFDDQSMIDGVKHILVGDTVLARRVVDLHPIQCTTKIAVDFELVCWTPRKGRETRTLSQRPA